MPTYINSHNIFEAAHYKDLAGLTALEHVAKSSYTYLLSSVGTMSNGSITTTDLKN